MFTKLGAGVVRRPVLVIVGWLLVIAGLIGGQAVLYSDKSPQPVNSQADFLPAGYDSVQAGKIAEKAFPTPKGMSMTLAVWRADNGRLTRADSTQASRLLKGVKVAGIDQVSVGSVAPNGKIQLGQAVLNEDVAQAEWIPTAQALRSATNDALRGTDLRAGYTGSIAAQADNPLGAMLEIGMLVLILVLLLVIFRSPIIALVNVVLIFVGAMAAGAALAIGADIIGYTIDDTTKNMLPVVLLGVGTDYVVFLLFRYREQLRRGTDKRTAMARAVGGVGEAVGVSALVVAVSFGALLLSDFSAFRLLGPALAFAVLFMLAIGLTLAPAVYCLMGRKAYWPSKLREPRRVGLAARTGAFVARRPAAAAILATVLLAVLGAGAVGMKSSYASPEMPSGTESARVMDSIESAFPAGVLSPTSVYLTGPGLTKKNVAAYAEKLTSVPIVADVSSTEIRGDVAQVDLRLNAEATSARAIDGLVRDLRPAARAAAPTGVHVVLGGETSASADVRTVLNHDLPIIFAAAAGLILLLLLVMLRGLIAPLYLIATVALGFVATLGASTLAFQQLAGKPGVGWVTPVIVYLFVTAIGTDYNILMIARIREELRAGRTPREAAARALEHAGPSVAAAGVILAGSFAVLMLSADTGEIGFAVTIGVLLSTFVLSWLLVPALTVLLGRAAFWPSQVGAGHGEITAPRHAAPTRTEPDAPAEELIRMG